MNIFKNAWTWDKVQWLKCLPGECEDWNLDPQPSPPPQHWAPHVSWLVRLSIVVSSWFGFRHCLKE